MLLMKILLARNPIGLSKKERHSDSPSSIFILRSTAFIPSSSSPPSSLPMRRDLPRSIRRMWSRFPKDRARSSITDVDTVGSLSPKYSRGKSFALQKLEIRVSTPESLRLLPEPMSMCTMLLEERRTSARGLAKLGPSRLFPHFSFLSFLADPKELASCLQTLSEMSSSISSCSFLTLLNFEEPSLPLLTCLLVESFKADSMPSEFLHM
mmetsp:Transcript_5571/g.11666  ORF Transcript_5571/g.11666 Transcript_5571/m.11666 type:complete len:209 (-) Transcript_5571:105-731(-)